MKKKESLGSPSCAVSRFTGHGLTVALGSFDGVHLGHAALLRTTVRNAGENGRLSAVWTFADDPDVLPEKAGMRSLTTLPEKLSLFGGLGIDIAILVRFSEVRGLSPEEFVAKTLVGECGAKAVVCGFNYTFGKNGAGNSETLGELFPGSCIVVPPVEYDGIPVSSSAIRRLLESGDAEEAAKLLGRPYFLDSPVVHGKELGRTLGLPTVNQDFPAGKLVPRHGIYASTVTIDGKDYVGVSNIGTRPTVDDSERVNCETHIIGYDGWLYGRVIRVSFSKYLRGEIKFPDVGALKAQIEHDADSAVKYFQGKTI